MSENHRDYSPEALWYVVHTFSGYENKVATSIEQLVENRGLQHMIQEVRVPTEMVTELNDGEKKEVERKIFPGYVLVKMIVTDDTWYLVRNIRGCTGFVGPDSEPIPLSDEEVARMGVGSAEVKVPFEVGDSVKVVDGMFEGMFATVTEIDAANGIVNVSISMFGRETPVELPVGSVVALD